MFLPCEVCGHSWGDNHLGLKVELAAVDAIDVLNLYCPLCGTAQGERTTLAHLGARQRSDGRLLQWSDHAGGTVSIDQADVVELEDVLYSAVPVFDDGTGTLQVPDLPVRPEYLELVDMERFRAHKKDGWWGRIDERQGVYVVRLPLLGGDAAQLRHGVEVRRPLVGRNGRPTTRPARDALEGFELSLWPKIRSEAWRTFVVEARQRLAADATAPQGDLHVLFAPAQGEGNDDRDSKNSLGLCAVPQVPFVGFRTQPGSDGSPGKPVVPTCRRYAALATRGRPQYVAVAGGGAGSGLAWGGVFLVELGVGCSRTGPSLTLGLDFGTSNSCVAFGNVTANHGLLPTLDANEYLIRGAPAGQPIPAAQYHPRFPTRGFGPSGEFLPSEMVTRWAAEMADAGPDLAHGAWRPGIDAGVLGNDVKWAGADASSVLVRGMKWSGETVGADRAITNRGPLLMAYLKTLLVHQVAQYCMRQESGHAGMLSLPSALTVEFGYPGSWDESELNALKAAISSALSATSEDDARKPRWGLGDWIEITAGLGAGRNEAFAAARVAQPKSNRLHVTHLPYSARLLVDIGGGSTDISLVWAASSDLKPGKIVEYVTSLRYAGEDLFGALLGPRRGAEIKNRCFLLGRTSSEITRLLRQGGLSRDLLDPSKRGMTERRVRAFFTQLQELLARLIASTVLSGQCERRNGESRQLDVLLARLGNGWGLGEAIYDNMERDFAFELRRRTAELVTHSEDAPPFRVDIIPMALLEGMHPKHAVAAGLLMESDGVDAQAYVSSQELELTADNTDYVEDSTVNYRSCVGLPTLVLPHDANSAKWVVPWWLPVEGGGHHVPNAHGEPLVPGANYDWPALWDTPADGPSDPARPNFPATAAGGNLSDFSRVFVESRPRLTGCLDLAKRWFKSSPLEVLLETGLRKRLQTMP